MSDDARFEDARERPLRLRAMDSDDLQVVSTLAQDAVFPVTEMKWQRERRRFGLLLNRFRWEDARARDGRSVERVQSVLAVEDVMAVRTSGFDRADRTLVMALLSISLEPGADGTGRLVLTLAGDGAVALDVEVLEVTLRDVTRPYMAPSAQVPRHDD